MFKNKINKKEEVDLDELLSRNISKSSLLDCDWNDLFQILKKSKKIELRKGKLGNVENYKYCLAIIKMNRKTTLDKVCEILEPISTNIEYINQIIFDEGVKKPEIIFLLIK
ncbi:MAG: hypothetical protein PHU51_04180 [Candidatus Nanoarchaeia archaeon]|nr:hypothetical protein [Candidatus Nanoarchaeia archaeon]